MEGLWLRSKLEQAGVTVRIPEAEDDRRAVYDIICQELSSATGRIA